MYYDVSQQKSQKHQWDILKILQYITLIYIHIYKRFDPYYDNYYNNMLIFSVLYMKKKKKYIYMYINYIWILSIYDCIIYIHTKNDVKKKEIVLFD